MAKTSKLFQITVVTLVLLIIALVAAIYLQRRAVDRAQLKERLLLDSQRLDAISEKAKLVTPHLPELKERAQALEEAFKKWQPRFYTDMDRPAVESFLNQITRTSQFELLGIEDVAVDENALFKEHVMNVRMRGPAKNLPVWANKFFSQQKLAHIDRISVISPDYKFQNVKIKVTLRYFEPRDVMQVAPDKIDLDRFGVDLSYVPPDADPDDPEYGEVLERTLNQARALDAMKKELADADVHERKIAGLQKLLREAQRLAESVASNRDLVLENLPTLYVRVRNSPLGSAALVVHGDTVTFPEIAGDD